MNRLDPRILARSATSSVNARYILRDPSEPQSLLSSRQVLRTSDQTPYLATKIPNTVTRDLKGGTTKTNLCDVIMPVAARPLSLILNHPNIVSLVDITKLSDQEGPDSEAGDFGDYTVWEDMDGGNLTYLLPNAATYPDFHDESGWHLLSAQTFNRPSLPEAICWHVLRSISKALLWLHTGVKETIGVPGEWLSHDDDWHPILIMDVSPGQIWFKKPRGEESFGECKLGGFHWARVTGAVGNKLAIAQRIEHAPLAKQYYFAPEIYKNSQSASRASEMWSLGAVLYTMMTGIPPPRFYEYDWQVSRLCDMGYTQGLRNIVGDMLKMHPADRPDDLVLVNRVEDEWRRWRATTKEGAYTVDVGDRFVERAAIARAGRGLFADLG